MVPIVTPEKEMVEGIIRHFEASDHCHLESYIVHGEEHLQATIAWGRGIPLSSHPMKIDLVTADRWLEEDIARRYAILEARVTKPVLARMWPGLKANFISWAYNGKGWIGSDSFKALVAGNFSKYLDGAAQWYHGEHGVVLPGLVRRRAAERHIGEFGDYDRVKHELNWYHDLPEVVNAGLKRGLKGGALVWKKNGGGADRLIWLPR